MAETYKKGNVLSVHALNECRWRRGVNFTPRLLFPQERTPVTIEYEAGWAAESVCTYWR